MAAFDLNVSLASVERRLARVPQAPPNLDEALAVATLPDEVRSVLLNIDLGETELVPADIVAYYAFNYGSSRALSFASALPVAALKRAEARSGWRPKSHALLRAVIRFRGRNS